MILVFHGVVRKQVGVSKLYAKYMSIESVSRVCLEIGWLIRILLDPIVLVPRLVSPFVVVRVPPRLTVVQFHQCTKRI